MRARSTGLIVSFACSPSARRCVSTRLIVFLAIADLLGEMPVFGSLALPGPPVSTWGGPWCVLQAAGNWYACLATWLWTMAYAHHVAAGVSHFSLFRPLPEAAFHVGCWGLPAAAVGVALGAGLLGLSDDGSQQCTIRSSALSMGFYSVLWVALLYNALVFFLVHRAMRSTLSANAPNLSPRATHQINRRLGALGNQFVLYLITFLGSQARAASSSSSAASIVSTNGSPVAAATPTHRKRCHNKSSSSYKGFPAPILSYLARDTDT